MAGSCDGDCDWVCDYCGAYMNDQRGFTVRKWKCKSCGALNDVSSNNVLDLLEMAARGITKFTTKPLQKPGKDRQSTFAYFASSFTEYLFRKGESLWALIKSW